MTENILQIEHLSKVYKTTDDAVYALNDVSIDIAKQSMTAIIGTSGSGKTTFLNMIGGMDKPDSGSVLFHDNTSTIDLCTLGDRALSDYRRDHVGFVFQSYELVPELTAIENIRLPFVVNKKKPDKEWIDRITTTLRLQDRLKHRPDQLSGGQKQRVAIARALMLSPELLLCDEPTGNLDKQTSDEVMALLQQIHGELQTTIVIVTHDNEVASTCDTILSMSDGRISE